MRKLLFFIAAAGLLAATMVALASASKSASGAGPALPGEVQYPWLPEGSVKALGPPGGADWTVAGGDLANDRYSTLTQLTPANVGKLHIIWQKKLPGGLQTPEGFEQQPIVLSGKNKNLPREAGTMYITTFRGMLALNPETGEELWKYEGPAFDTFVGSSATTQQRAPRMEQYFKGMVFMGQQDHSLVALNSKTGAPIWSVQTTAVGTFGRSSGSLNAPPMMRAFDEGGDGIVLSGFTGGDSPLRGHQDAYNAKTGKLIWRTWLTPDPTQLPYILTWANPAEAALGGAALWSQPAVDPQLGMVYFGTGNAYPETGRQPGKNLWTDSLMAVDWKTGALKWYFQHVHHDMWDYDAPGVPILANLKIDGKMYPAIMQGAKTGVIWVMNRKNGGPIPKYPIKETKVPDHFDGKGFALTNAWPTQPKAFGGVGEITEQCYTPELAKLKFPTYPLAPDGKPMIATCPFAAPYSTAYVAWGGGTGGGGGIGWVMMSYSPKTNYLYYCAQVEGIAVATRSPTDPTFSQLSAGARAGVVGGIGGTFGAIDMAQNKIAWKHDYQGILDETCYSGSLSTAGGLAFTATRGNVYVDPYFGGKIYAYDAKTGQELWSYQNQGDSGTGNHVPAGQIEGAPTTFMVNGKQYLFVGMMDRGGELQGANRRIQNVYTLFGL